MISSLLHHMPLCYQGDREEKVGDVEDDNAAGAVDDPQYESFGYMGNLNLNEGEN